MSGREAIVRALSMSRVEADAHVRVAVRAELDVATGAVAAPDWRRELARETLVATGWLPPEWR